MNKIIHIVTGKIQSGKTTSLFTFANSLGSVDGILAPIIDEKRRLYHISSRTIKDFQADQRNNNTIEVGKYSFYKESFKWANEKLIKGFESGPEWLIIDELGKLELRKEGLYESSKYIIDKRKYTKTNIILVIRDYLLEQILEFYNINEGEYYIMSI